MKGTLRLIKEYGDFRAWARAEPSFEKEYLEDADAKLKEIKKLLLCGTPKRNTSKTPYLHFDYRNQAWIKNGLVVDCGHEDDMDCRCYQRLHAGETHTCNNQCH